MIEYVSYDAGSDININEKSIYKYDERGNMIAGEGFYGDGEFNKTYKYDDKFNLIEQVSYNSDGSVSSKVTYKYDINGNKIEETMNNIMEVDNEEDRFYKYTYKYDDKGNEIEQVSLTDKGTVAL